MLSHLLKVCLHQYFGENSRKTIMISQLLIYNSNSQVIYADKKRQILSLTPLPVKFLPFMLHKAAFFKGNSAGGGSCSDLL